MTTRESSARRRLRAVSFTLGLLAGAWSALLWQRGGFGIVLFGKTITTHAPLRPLLVASLFFLLFILTGGELRLPDLVRHALRSLARWIVRLALRARPRHGAWALAAAVVVLGVERGSTVAGGADSFGYISEAQLWAHGQLSQPMPLINQVPWPIADLGLAPLGYRPSLSRDAIVPAYAPGLPMLMAVAQRIAGYCAIGWVVPLCGAALVLGTFGLGARLSTPARGLAAALLVATSPVFLYMLVNPMSDVPVAAAWALAFLVLIRPGSRAALGAGALAGLALLIRPNLLPSIVAPVGYLVWLALRVASDDRRRSFARLAFFCLGLVPGVVFPLWMNWYLFGSPLKSGYGTLDTLFALENILPNIWNYARWITDSQTPIMLIGLVPLFLPLRRFWAGGQHRAAVMAIGAFVFTVWAQYCYYATFDAWWYLRFLLPCWPFVMLGVPEVACHRLPAGRRWSTAILVIGLVGLAAFGVAQAQHRSVFRLWEGERRYLTVAAEVRAMTGRQTVIFSAQHSGSLRYYAGRTTIRYDNFEPDWLDRSIAWFAERGIRTYLLAEAWELEVFKTRFAGQQALTRLAAPPLFVYDGPFTIYFFDLDPAASRENPVRFVTETYDGPSCVLPVLPPALVVTR